MLNRHLICFLFRFLLREDKKRKKAEKFREIEWVKWFKFIFVFIFSFVSKYQEKKVWMKLKGRNEGGGEMTSLGMKDWIRSLMDELTGKLLSGAEVLFSSSVTQGKPFYFLSWLDLKVRKSNSWNLDSSKIEKDESVENDFENFPEIKSNAIPG